MGIQKTFPTTTITSANTDTEVYKRTSGRRLKIKELEITNHNTTSPSRVRIWDGPSTDGRLKADVWVGTQATMPLPNLARIVEHGNVVAQATVVDVSVSGSGEEE